MYSTSAARSADIHAPQHSCDGCPFGGPKVGAKGNTQAPLVFVAESPGRQEVKEGAPLVGPSGNIFHKFVPDDDSIYVLNALECSPSKALKSEARLNIGANCCHDRLIDKITAYPRRLIVAMGNPAVRSITGDFSLKITQIRGQLIPSEYAELGILPVVHIAALMKGTGSFRQWREDITYALELGNGGPPREHLKASVEMIPLDATQGYVDSLFHKFLWDDDELTCDIETSGLNYLTDRILTIGVTPKNDKSISYCFLPHHLPLLKKHLESKNISWAYHNGKFDVKFFRQAGINARVDDDTMLMSYALDETGGVHDLEQVSGDVLGAPNYKYMIQPYLPNKNSSYELIPLPVLAEYQAIDTSNTAQIRSVLRKRVAADPDLEKLYTQTLMPASAFYMHVEETGFQVDLERLDENEARYGQELTEIGEEINEICQRSVNPNSPQQMSVVLFKQFRLPNRWKGSTDKHALEGLRKSTGHPIIPALMKYRKRAKAKGTYITGVRKWIQADGRVHTSILIHGTRTGRPASKEPNIFNLPRDPQIRGQFVAADGYELVEVDIKQAEMCSLAALSGDPSLCRIYLEGGDIHDELAIYLFDSWLLRYHSADRAIYQDAYEERVKCKNINFGIIFGITEYGLQEQIGGSLRECRHFLAGWFDRFPIAGEFINTCRATVLSNRVMTTCFGRKKRVGLISRENLNFLQNEAANFPHQSIATDITLHAALRTYRALQVMGIRIVNTVYDSIVMEIPITGDGFIKARAIQMVSNEMSQVPIDWGITRVPFTAEAEHGHRWGSLEEYKEAA